MAHFEEFSVLSVLEKGGFIVQHIEDGWHIYPGGLFIEEAAVLELESDGYVYRKTPDAETTQFYITSSGIARLAYLKNIATDRAYPSA